MKQKTWPALELFKALAIGTMVINHSWGKIISQQEIGLHKNTFSLNLANAIHALFFFNIWIPALAASSLRLQSELIKNVPGTHSSPPRLALKWGIILWISGYVFSFFSKESLTFFMFNPLHFLGLSFFLLALLIRFVPRKLNWPISLAFVGLSFLFYLFKNSLFQFPEISPYFAPDVSLIQRMQFFALEILFGTPRTGWSVFPWFSLCLIGYSLADSYVYLKGESKLFRKFSAISFLVGISGLLFPSSFDFIKQQDISGELLMLFMPFGLFLSVTAGYVFFLTLFSLFYHGIKEPWALLINSLSRGSFWIFFLQFPLISNFSIPFQDTPFEIRLFVFPLLVLLWCFGIGFFILELSKKQLTIKIRKDG
ncbi:MAG: hypothetical protein EB078_10740, partial [Proteobacteria bacterium]|nr:hypothetical protein [Pseudomonadota bacterium]NDD05373.1 hypothetical protein [Pseudomonadota bacterium]NDG27823.1 hypothetical protein [Pseudomonadota bacterium]